MTAPKEVHLFDTVLSVYGQSDVHGNSLRVAVKIIDRYHNGRGKILVNREDFLTIDDAVDFARGAIQAFTDGALDGTL